MKDKMNKKLKIFIYVMIMVISILIGIVIGIYGGLKMLTSSVVLDFIEESNVNITINLNATEISNTIFDLVNQTQPISIQGV